MLPKKRAPARWASAAGAIGSLLDKKSQPNAPTPENQRAAHWIARHFLRVPIAFVVAAEIGLGGGR
jgi:hypothetical protein